MDGKHVLKREPDVKTERPEDEDSDDQELQVDSSEGNSNENQVQTVVLRNLNIEENDANIPIILNNFPNSNSDGNLQIDALEENVIHTYIIE